MQLDGAHDSSSDDDGDDDDDDDDDDDEDGEDNENNENGNDGPEEVRIEQIFPSASLVKNHALCFAKSTIIPLYISVI